MPMNEDENWREANCYWSVQLWWQDGLNRHEAGGHFMYVSGDGWQKVLDDVIELRKAPRERLTKVTIELVGKP